MVWTVNERIANDLTEIFKLKNFYALPNPIDCDEILSKSEMPCDIEFDKNKLNVVILGRLSSEKGISRVLKAVSSGAFCGCRDYHLYVIGGGDNLEKIRSRLVELKINDRVTMLGSKANPFPYLKQADLLICPSRYESFGLVMIEAMLLKVPVITTATSGGRYVTQDGRYAVCVENNDGALCEAVREYLSNPDSYRFSVEEAYEWARMHDTSRFADRLLYLLNKCQK